MKPAPRPKPKRIRVVLIYTIESPKNVSLKSESNFLDVLLREHGRIVKSDHLEFAKWGSKKPCRVVNKVNGNIEGNNINITSGLKIASGKVKRHLDFGAMKYKK